MLRIITAATALAVLVACDSEGIDRATNDPTNIQPASGSVSQDDSQNNGQNNGQNDATAGNSGSNTSGGNTTGGTATAGGSTGSTGSTTSNTGSTGNSGTTTISDDAGSATSDGGNTAIISDDAGSSSSDGGIPADAASGSSDGGSGNTDTTTSTQGTDQGGRDTDAGSFASNNSGGNVIRTSSLASSGQNEACTALSNRDDYSNIYIGDFILHNNAWRAFRAPAGYEWDQCIYSNRNGALAGWNWDWGPGTSSDFYVRSYPELIFGVKDEFRKSGPQSETGLPVRLSQMPNIQIDYSYDGPQYGDARAVDASQNPRFPNGSTISGERNVAIESFFYDADSAGNCSEDIVTRAGGSNHVYEVMVWLDAGAERLPAGASDFVADLTIRGDAYKVYTKGADPRYIAFVAQNPQTTGTIYWNDFTDWAKNNAHQVRELYGARSNSVQIQDDWCVANILVGTEIFWGAGNIDIFDWTITQSQ